MHVCRSFLLLLPLTGLRLLSDADINKIVCDGVLIRALSLRLIDTVLPLSLPYHHTSQCIYTIISNNRKLTLGVVRGCPFVLIFLPLLYLRYLVRPSRSSPDTKRHGCLWASWRSRWLIWDGGEFPKEEVWMLLMLHVLFLTLVVRCGCRWLFEGLHQAGDSKYMPCEISLFLQVLHGIAPGWAAHGELLG